jgi:TusA-related sulfurtransferase
MAERIVVDREIDITGEICPMTFVRTRLALDGLQPGQVLAVLLRGEEPARNVPETARQQGHRVLAEEALRDGNVRVVIERKA